MENDRFVLNRNSDVKVIYIGTGQFQLASGKWVDAILYKYKGVYKMMEASEFIGLAEPDRSTTLDEIGDIIGPGYTPDIEPDRQVKVIIRKMKYEYKGNVYNYVGVGKFKDSTGKWIDAIIYERDNHIYMREITDFIDKFKKA